MNFGIQLFSLPKMLETDLPTSLQLLAEMGYQELETYGPYPFSAAASKAGWDAITPMLGFSGSGYYGRSLADFSALLNDYNLRVPSMHTDFETIESAMPQLAQAADKLGATYVTIPTTPEDLRTSLDDYHRLAERFNQIGESAHQFGLKFAYHNHGYGLTALDGQLPIQILLDETEVDKVFWEIDIYWTTAGGLDPIDLLNNNPGRYHLLHIKDMREKVRFSGDGGNPSQWMELFPYMTTAGDGILDLPGIMQAAKSSGVKHFIVEQDIVAEPEVALKRSIDYLQTL
ncbi:MAG: sugar phosphate isomerase/epimerase family protein [Bacteroidia bacterium]